MNEIIVSESDKGPYVQVIKVGQHVLVADEPEEMGGNDAGPSPYDYLLVALGTCTSITVRMYAERKKMPLIKTIVKLTHKKIYKSDCEDCEKESSRIDVIDRKIEFQGNLTESDRERLLQIANACPVHKTLTHSVKITTELMEG